MKFEENHLPSSKEAAKSRDKSQFAQLLSMMDQDYANGIGVAPATKKEISPGIDRIKTSHKSLADDFFEEEKLYEKPREFPKRASPDFHEDEKLRPERSPEKSTTSDGRDSAQLTQELHQLAAKVKRKLTAGNGLPSSKREEMLTQLRDEYRKDMDIMRERERRIIDELNFQHQQELNNLEQMHRKRMEELKVASQKHIQQLEERLFFFEKKYQELEMHKSQRDITELKSKYEAEIAHERSMSAKNEEIRQLKLRLEEEAKQSVHLRQALVDVSSKTSSSSPVFSRNPVEQAQKHLEDLKAEHLSEQRLRDAQVSTRMEELNALRDTVQQMQQLKTNLFADET